jgi:cytochrome c
MVAAGVAGLIWDEAHFVEYVQGPADFLKKQLGGPATAKMQFKVKDAASAEDVYAYLSQFSPAQ